jgi:ribosome assembly protein 4
VNVVKWGGGGIGGKGVLYTGSSDRTVKVWDADAVSFLVSLLLFRGDGVAGKAIIYA